MCFYQKQYTSLFMYSAVLIAYPILLFNNQINVNIIYALNGAQLFLSFTSKLIQAVVNYRNSSTGKLSAITLMLQFLGCIARIFTSVQETGDLSLIVSYSLATFINGVLVLQLFYYWNKEKENVKKDQ
jgi:mannose-P-dolichol utilization defect protein 1